MNKFFKKFTVANGALDHYVGLGIAARDVKITNVTQSDTIEFLATESVTADTYGATTTKTLTSLVAGGILTTGSTGIRSALVASTGLETFNGKIQTGSAASVAYIRMDDTAPTVLGINSSLVIEEGIKINAELLTTSDVLLIEAKCGDN